MTDPNAAEVLEQDGPEQKVTAEEANAKGVQPGDADPTDAELNDAETHPKKKGGWLRKLERLREENAILIDTLRKVGGKPAEAEQKDKQPNPDDPPTKPVRPKIGDFDDFQKYDAALAEYEQKQEDYLDQKLAFRLKQEESVKAQRTQQAEVANGWAARVAEAKKQYADFEEVAFSEDTPMNEVTMNAIVTSDLGAEIAYYLGQHPEEAERINGLAPIAAVREIGKIESRIADQKSAAAEEDKEPAATASRAPRPPQPVRRQSAVNADPDDKDDYKTWLRKREAQLQRK